MSFARHFPTAGALVCAVAAASCDDPHAKLSTAPTPAPSVTAPTPASAPGTPSPKPSVPPAAVSENLRDLLETSLASGKKEIVLPPGRYRVTPKNREHLALRGLRDRVIIADGVELVCTETTRALTIENCHNVTLRGLTIDYDPLPYTHARIEEISPDRSTLKVRVIDGYPAAETSTGSLEIFDPATNRLRGLVTYFSTRCEPGENGTATLTKARVQPEAALEQVGDIAVFKVSHAPGGEIPHALMASDSTGLVFENVTLFAANMFGFFETGCDGSKYLGCTVARRSPESDPVRRGHPRLRSLNADAFHSKNAAHGPAYERCTAHFMGDDAIAINGDFHFVTRGEGKTWRVLAKHKMNMREGDEMQIFTYDGRRLEDRKIISITPDSGVTEEEQELIAKQQMNETLRKTGLSSAFLVELDHGESVPPGTVVCSAGRIGSGFSIRDCRVGFNRSRGILVKAGRGEISGNIIEGSVMTAILISPEYWWLEAGLADDLIIANNRIENGGGMGIAVVAEGGDRSLAPAGAFRNFRVTGNTVKGGASPGLLLTSIRGLSTEGNTVEPDPAKELFPWQVGSWGRDGIEPEMRINVE